MRVGTGYDVHRLVENRALILGGVRIEHQLGLLGHSDADVLVHAIMDALLGALALGDIGKHFPDTDPKYKNCDSLLLLEQVGELVGAQGYIINNIDSTIIAQAPKLKPYIDEMVINIENCLGLTTNRVSVKATTEEGLGFSGREEGIAANAVVSLLKGEGK
ncbi:2-C-methyl-D-erythritol 2,4-cyclodiphosphate synthase [Eubacteriaceae bacterium ES3]|nr:2-C-methyl-D-erythritol 2,4-cyclodiphosphate synthase [Eubacteriaceae bacterium ES3]